METRYIVVMFREEFGYTLRENNAPLWFSSRYVKAYKNLGSATRAANKIFNRYLNDYVCVFKVYVGEDLSYSMYKEWLKDNDRLVWTTRDIVG